MAAASTGGVVLAGGASTRFAGGAKALATLGGDTLIERVVAAVRAATDERPVVAVRTDEQRAAFAERLDDVTFATDAPEFEGPLAGVVGGLGAAGADWLFVPACDMPLLSAAAIGGLRGRIDSDAAAVVPVHADGTPEPMHAFYRRDAVESAVPRLPAAGGVRALLDALDPVRRVPIDGALADSVTNVNTRADLATVRRRLER